MIALASRQRADRLVVRIEDLDPGRTVVGATDRILDDLEWLGIAWDEGPRASGDHGPYFQSQRSALYDGAIDRLRALGLAYSCTCSRAEIARSASAPHVGDEGPRYPGTCRDASARKTDRPPAVRLRSPDPEIDDFVLRRADGIASYQLAVIVDDLAMEIDEVVRGEDLLTSTPRQELLARLLGATPPRYVHLPMVLGPDGERLAKRHQAKFSGSTIAELRALGLPPSKVRADLEAALAQGASWTPSCIAPRT